MFRALKGPGMERPAAGVPKPENLGSETADLTIAACRYDTFIGLCPCVDPPGFVAIFSVRILPKS
jgi:hypothetical protein